MTRTAPLMTLLAVGVLGGALFVANTVGAQQDAALAAQNAAVSAEAPAAPAAPAADGAGDVDLGAVPVAGADPAADSAEVDLADVPVATGADAADDEPAALEDGVYAGRTDDRSLTVAIAIKDGEAEAYVCDGERIEFWLSGTATEDGLDLASADGDATMTGTLDGDTFSGTITVGDDEWDYTAEETTVERAAAAGREDVGEVADRVGL